MIDQRKSKSDGWRLKISLCPLCKNEGKTFYKDEFFLCDCCGGIFKDKNKLLNNSLEKQRYELHNNDVEDEGYHKFVSPITNEVLKNFSKNHLGLDFGCGSGPVITKILQDNGYSVNMYDPYFYPKNENLTFQYDYITSCEVIEHFYNPNKEFELLKSLLKPKGILYCMTHLYDETIDFEKWYYKNDPTHVFIYQAKTIQWIKEHYNFSNFTIDKRLITLSKMM